MLELGGGAEEEGCGAPRAVTFQNPGVAPAPPSATPAGPTSFQPKPLLYPRPAAAGEARKARERKTHLSPLSSIGCPRCQPWLSEGLRSFTATRYTSLLGIRTTQGGPRGTSVRLGPQWVVGVLIAPLSVGCS